MKIKSMTENMAELDKLSYYIKIYIILTEICLSYISNILQL